MKKQLQALLEKRVQQCVGNVRENDPEFCPKIERKKESCSKRNAEIVKAKAAGNIIDINRGDGYENLMYHVHVQYLIKQKDLIVIEEEVELRKAVFSDGELLLEEEICQYGNWHDSGDYFSPSDDTDERLSYQYDRLKAVQYAERWWNGQNPAYKYFTDDCTNFISQCVRAGGAPMRGMPNKSKGWWMTNSWSYSWTVAHSFKNYLSTSKIGLRAKEVGSPRELLLGDLICYDFQGDGRFDHNTIVTGRDAYGMPLVNAHTTDSRKRYWAYEDSTAYTPNMKYKFYTIVDDQ